MPGVSGGKYLSSSGFGETFGAGHSSYSTSKGHGHGHSQGGKGHGLGGYLDPFSILGGLAFLVYLGLLFQQTMTPTAGMRTEEDLLNPADFESLSFLPQRHNRQYRSLDLQQNTSPDLALILKSLDFLFGKTEERCPLLEYCRILKQIQGNALL